jgi:hypothetical protein
VRIGWLLIALVTLSQITMPLTQHLWTWDRFLHGGQDFETGTFLILISFCLIVVMMRACKSVVERLLACWRRLVARPVLRSPAALLALASPCSQHAVECPSEIAYSLPLQI